MVTSGISRYPTRVTRKVLVSLDERLLRRIDAAAEARGVSRSRFLAELAEREVGPPRRTAEEQREIEASFRRLRALARELGTPGDATEFIRRERDRRGERLA